MNKCVFLDRDGVMNKDDLYYTYKTEDFFLIDGVKEAILGFYKAGYKIIVITNQAGIAKKLYTSKDVNNCHEYLNQLVGGVINGFYHSPYHPSVTNSLSRKPESLLFEKAISKFKIDIDNSFMVGDKERDLIPAKKIGIKTIKVGNNESTSYADHYYPDLISFYKSL